MRIPSRPPLLCFILLVGFVPAALHSQITSTPPERLKAQEFARLVLQLSEPGGEFLSDNLISNETGYIPVIEKLAELKATGGAYIGVGPEQNFTYIARIRPQIAFIIDIRHLAVTQHLMYKAIFQLSEDRPHFLARLLSRPLKKGTTLTAGSSVDELVSYFAKAPVDEAFAQANLAELQRTIETEYKLPLSPAERGELEYLLTNFKKDGLEISFRLNMAWNYFPTLREVIIQKDRKGRSGHFLGNADDYDFLREMEMRNLIIPINGNFAGKKALSSIGAYLKANNLPVSVFYTSNVEQYLFQDEIFGSFVANVKSLPLNDKSLFIRSVLERYGNPPPFPGDLFTMQLQRMSLFVKDFDDGKYGYYGQLVTTNVIHVYN